ncbi:hypothetical protein RQP46_004032 [Phenoliferia psychrophenolica]
MLATQSAYIPRQPPLIHKAVQRPPAPPPAAKVAAAQPPPAATATTTVAAQPAPPAGTGSLCKHVQPLVKAAGEPSSSSHFALGVRWSLRLASSGSAKRRKLEPPSCRVCNVALARPLLCLDCGLTLCGARDGQDHAKLHAKSRGHELFLDLRSRSVYCYACSDYVYHPVLERIISLQVVAHEDAYAAAATPPARGLRNLGQTCYMSVILQAFLANPLLRSYFLSDRHNSLLCPISIAGEKPCLCCEMDRLFSETYVSDGTPFGPTSILYSTWLSSSELSGYAQQDAHEFLISAMNLLHSSCPGSTNSHCTCIIHQTFAGQLRSEVRCGKCANVTTSADPFLDLSLDLKGGKKLADPTGAHNTLAGCLNRFTSPEQLAPGEYTCAKCGDASNVASKRLGIKKLPPVLCIQLKRFEHSAGSSKIDTAVRFPLKLNMRPYTTSAIPTSPPDSTPSSLFEYELSSVVCHEGQLNNGHFTTFCRAVDDFYCLDDDKVRRAPIAEVLGSMAYLLTYVKRTLPFAERQ